MRKPRDTKTQRVMRRTKNGDITWYGYRDWLSPEADDALLAACKATGGESFSFIVSSVKKPGLVPVKVTSNLRKRSTTRPFLCPSGMRRFRIEPRDRTLWVGKVEG